MIVCRFSHSGFEPQFQHELFRHVEYINSFDPKTIQTLTPYAQQQVIQGVKSQKDILNQNFSFMGIHVFFVPLEPEDMRFFLNHLNEIPPVHYEELPGNTPACSLDSPYCGEYSTLDYLKNKGHVGCYIPM